MRAVAACFDETRAPSWYRSYRPQALGSASTLEAGPTYRATVTPESLQAAGKLPSWLPCAGPCATTLASSYFFCVPFGGRANGRVSRTPRPTPSPTTAAPAPSMQTAPTAARASRLFAHMCAPPRRATGLPTPIATTAAPARVPPGPGRQHVGAGGPDHRLMWKQK